MAKLIIATTIVIFLNICSGLDADETQLSSILLSALYDLEKDVCANEEDGIQKCSSCNNLVYCYQNQTLYEIDCRIQNPRMPYCSNAEGSCVAHKNNCTEPNPVGDFTCPDKGLYPDIYNCRKFLVCSNKNETGAPFNCKAESTYNHSAPGCSTGAPCNKQIANCGNLKKAILYQSNIPRLFIVCNAQKGIHLLRDCGKNMKYDLDSSKCVYHCKREGLFPDPTTSERFYECVLSGQKYVAYSYACPEGHSFDDELKICSENTKPDDL